MITKILHKNILLTILFSILICSLGFYLLYIYKYSLYNTEKIKNSDYNSLNDFVDKFTNIYLENSKDSDKYKVELHCYSIMFILKFLTGDKSNKFYEYLNELKIKDLDGFKNFVIYVNSKLILENDKKKIYKILKYFIDEKNEVNIKITRIFQNSVQM